MNSVKISGTLLNDVQLYYTPAGQAVVNFNLQTLSCGGHGQTAIWRNFIPVIALGKIAEECSQHLKKGNKIFVEGKLHSRNYNTLDGERKIVLEVLAEKIEPA
ncbi:hypothetical protein AUJ66_00955 [Candidatus Desantisbacteria bacterium CG1_02_38_46]|uniref:Single-stranded DNA-binding protein n=3 Tax=unclassified Candidatus Desantisiibacteriota TaxID=3106372 RepID=A0A2H9PB40_9BACT|nr:MAG: hypothetical protein AUJ66_00955 [Candidatus Desantisbacteria bacterium CG1_02_38_46]PIU51481.1 MAG: single-stranded DNA-binding protein [Candidatus Desantisbacteria bacterium CG07_land_8_20_14_0_80_39_15]PIZ15913.1 MAG: single-stranded DNA-binding protein [Candidatus Desantisbacteria bacterium CG_4_10_14_0_8_um_filter_39_17]